jgi:hypothetical protein
MVLYTFRGALILGVCCLAVGCSKPILNVTDLNGCYFAKGPNPVFEIREAKLLAPQLVSKVAISSNTSDTSVITFSPGIRVTEDDHKSMVVVRGSEISGLSFQRWKKRYILLANGAFPVQLEQRDCMGKTGGKG